jgi:hypothetical protein
MKNNALLNQEVAFGADQWLKVTALLYLKEALANQEYETCPDLINTAKELGVDPGEISTLIKGHLEADTQVRPKGYRLPA